MSQVVIFDTEYTSWDGAMERHWDRPHEHKEVFQIGAIKLTRGEDWRTAPTFDVLVKPVVNPVLSGFVSTLTGIAQADVEAKGLGLEEALRQFAAFVGEAVPVSNGDDLNVLAESCGLQKVIFPMEPRRFLSLRPMLYDALSAELGRVVPTRGNPSGTLYKLLDVALPTSQVHNALHDVYSLAGVCCELERRGHDVLPWPAK